MRAPLSRRPAPSSLRRAQREQASTPPFTASVRTRSARRILGFRGLLVWVHADLSLGNSWPEFSYCTLNPTLGLGRSLLLPALFRPHHVDVNRVHKGGHVQAVAASLRDDLVSEGKPSMAFRNAVVSGFALAKANMEDQIAPVRKKPRQDKRSRDAGALEVAENYFSNTAGPGCCRPGGFNWDSSGKEPKGENRLGKSAYGL